MDHELRKQLGALFRTNFERCERCTPWRRKVTDRFLIGFDLEPFQNPMEEAYVKFVLTRFVLQDKICIHDPRVWIHVNQEERTDMGRVLRARAVSELGRRLGTLADLLLEEGPFHPSKCHKLTDEELELL